MNQVRNKYYCGNGADIGKECRTHCRKTTSNNKSKLTVKGAGAMKATDYLLMNETGAELIMKAAILLLHQLRMPTEWLFIIRENALSIPESLMLPIYTDEYRQCRYDNYRRYCKMWRHKNGICVNGGRFCCQAYRKRR